MVYFNDIFNREPTVEESEFLLQKLDLSPFSLKKKLLEINKLTSITEDIEPQKDLTTYFEDKEGNVEEKPSQPVSSTEVGSQQVQDAVKKYIKDKSQTNKQITSNNTIKFIRNVLNIAEGDTKWDEDIWTYAINFSKDLCVRKTPKTIYFR